MYDYIQWHKYGNNDAYNQSINCDKVVNNKAANLDALIKLHKCSHLRRHTDTRNQSIMHTYALCLTHVSFLSAIENDDN